jgi:ketosteroid isomerase-like protein
LAEFERASAAKDWHAVAALLAPDAVFFFNDGTFRGLEQIRRAFESTWAYDPEEEAYVLEDIEWLAQGESSAACVYGFRWEGVLKGRPFKVLGRGTAVMRRDADGWRIVHEHLSAKP